MSGNSSRISNSSGYNSITAKTLVTLHKIQKKKTNRETVVRNIELDNFDFIIIVCTAIFDHITSYYYIWIMDFYLSEFLCAYANTLRLH